MLAPPQPTLDAATGSSEGCFNPTQGACSSATPHRRIIPCIKSEFQSYVFANDDPDRLRLCSTFRDGARSGIIQENEPHTPGDPPLKTNPMLASQFLLLPADMRLEEVALDKNCLLLVLSSTQLTAACPYCSCLSARVHSHYTRTLVDHSPLKRFPGCTCSHRRN